MMPEASKDIRLARIVNKMLVKNTDIDTSDYSRIFMMWQIVGTLDELGLLIHDGEKND